MGQPTPTRSAAEQWVADLPAPAVDGREPWPVLSFPPEARSLLARGQTQWMPLEPLPTGRDAAVQRPPRALPKGLMPVPVPPPIPPTIPQRAQVKPMPVARANAGPQAWPPRVLRQATPAMYAAQAGGPIRGRMPGVEKKSLGMWSFFALVLGIASLAPFLWQDAPEQWIPATGLTAMFCAFMVFTQAQRGVTRHGTISAARWGCGFAVFATAIWIVGILLLTGSLSSG